MKTWPRMWVAGALILGIVGCDSSPEVLSGSESGSLDKLRSGQYTLVSNQELANLKHDAELGKNMGRYQMHREGLRTWRLDTATGKVCLLLTSDVDWKKPEIQVQGCFLSASD